MFPFTLQAFQALLVSKLPLEHCAAITMPYEGGVCVSACVCVVILAKHASG